LEYLTFRGGKDKREERGGKRKYSTAGSRKTSSYGKDKGKTSPSCAEKNKIEAAVKGSGGAAGCESSKTPTGLKGKKRIRRTDLSTRDERKREAENATSSDTGRKRWSKRPRGRQ